MRAVGSSIGVSHSTRATSGTSAQSEDSRRDGCWYVHWVFVFSLVAAQVAIGIFPLLVPEDEIFRQYREFRGPEDFLESAEYWRRTQYGGMVRQFAAWLAFMLFLVFHWFRVRKREQWDESRLADQVANYILAIWLANVVQAACHTVLWYLPCPHCPIVVDFKFKDLVSYLVTMQYVLTEYYFYVVVGYRLAFVEVGWGANLGHRWLVCTRRVGLLMQILLITVGNLKIPNVGSSGHFWASVNVAQAWMAFSATVIIFWALTQVRKPTLQPVPHGIAQAEQAWARDYLTFIRAGMVTPLAVNGLGYFAKAILFNFHFFFDEYSMVLDSVATMLSLISEAICLLLILGAFRGPRAEVRAEDAERPALARVFSPRCASTDIAAWNAKVLALAHRGVTASALLDFYERLGPGGDAMLHFAPQLSTTSDVVRQAVIPLSCSGDGGVAYAELVQLPDQGLPARMVTHTWGCRFSVLVAAVLADAIDEDECVGIVAALEAGRCLELRDQLEACGTAARPYWICAFCINQHANICGGFSPAPDDVDAYKLWDARRRDTVTGQIYPVCSCNQPKFFNDCPDECELNKFDDMMAELHDRVPEFQQLVVVDPDFSVFTRAWCVAELVQANLSHIPQSVKLLSRRGIDLYSGDMTVYKRLATLTVTGCQASRQEDKERIMSGILDVQAFDSQVQDMIFGDSGLMRQQFVGFGLLDAAVRTARRLLALSAK